MDEKQKNTKKKHQLPQHAKQKDKKKQNYT